MADINDSLLQLLNGRPDGFDTIDASAELKIDHQKIVGAVKSLQSLGDVS